VLARKTVSSPPGTQEVDLLSYIAALESGGDVVNTLQKLTLFCIANPSIEAPSTPSSGIAFPTSPSPFITPSTSISSVNSGLWENDRRFDKLFSALVQHLDPSKSEDELEYGLILLWEILENQPAQLEGKEGEIFSVLLRVRYCNMVNVRQSHIRPDGQITFSIIGP
jgi:CLIP-associating protein 1/2